MTCNSPSVQALLNESVIFGGLKDRQAVFLLTLNEDIAESDPVGVVDAVVESLGLRDPKKLYRKKDVARITRT